MNFRNDNQRKAMFAAISGRNCHNSFTKRRELGKSTLKGHVDDQGRYIVSSDVFPNVSFKLATDIPSSETHKFISELDEESLAGVDRVAVVAPRVMKAYKVVPGFYTGDEEKVPFGRLDAPKIVVPGETRGRKSDTFIPRVSKEIAKASFDSIYNEYGDSDLPKDLLQEEYLSQVYTDYIPSRDYLSLDEDVRRDLEDEVWRVRAEHRLVNPTTMEARAWRMGKHPKTDIETFVDLPKRKYEKTGRYKKAKDEQKKEDEKPSGVEVETSVLTFDDMMSDLYGKRDSPLQEEVVEKVLRERREDQGEVSAQVGDITEEDWVKDSDIGYRDTIDLIDSDKFEVVSRLDTDYLKDLQSYIIENWDKRLYTPRKLIERELQSRGEDI